MDIFNIQALIKERKIVTANDIDPTESYLQVGVFQEGNRRSNSSNADAYPSYAIPISEVSGKSNKKMIVVDEAYGDDTTAVAAGIYDFNKPFKTIDAAILAAQVKDTLWLMPGGNYTVTENLLDKSLTIYAWSCYLIFQGAQTGTDYAILTIKGNASIYIVTGGNFNTTPCAYANIDIECNEFFTFDYVPFYLDHLDYSQPCYFALKANYLNIQDQFFFFAALNYNINVDIGILDRSVPGYPGFEFGDFWSTNLGAGGTTGYATVCRYNIGKANIYSTTAGYSLVKADFGAPENKYYVTGTYIAENIDTSNARPTAIVYQDQAQSFVEINATMNLKGIGAYATRNAVSQAIIRGNIYHDSTSNGYKYGACYYIQSGKVKLYADTICVSKYAIYIELGPSSPYLDIIDCKIINNQTGGLNLYIISSRVSMYNCKFIVNPANTYSAAASAALTVNAYALYDNIAMDNATISNALSATGVLGEITSTSFTLDTNF